jgi:hypothetical protein
VPVGNFGKTALLTGDVSDTVMQYNPFYIGMPFSGKGATGVSLSAAEEVRKTKTL